MNEQNNGQNQGVNSPQQQSSRSPSAQQPFAQGQQPQQEEIDKRGCLGCLVLAIVGVLGILLFIGVTSEEEDSGSSKNAASESSAGESALAAFRKTVSSEGAKPEEPDDNTMGPGMYKVGTDLPAGEYLLFPSSIVAGYYQISKDSTGSFSSIITNDNFGGTRYVTVAEGQYLELERARMMDAAEAEPQKPEDGVYPPGMYKVGVDIEPGEYKLSANGAMAYVEVSKDSRGGLHSIMTNDNFEGEKYITVRDGQYIKLNNCTLK